MSEKNRAIKKIIENGVLYTTLFNRELNQLNEHSTIKTFVWLKLIDEYNNPSISKLGMNINVSKSQMTSRIDKLVAKGLVERINDDMDRRIIRIKLTKQGQDFLDNTQRTLEADIKELLNPMDLEEIKELETGIQTIKNTVLKLQHQKKNPNTLSK